MSALLSEQKRYWKDGQVLDLQHRVSNTRLYIGEKIRDAHDIIYKLG